MGDAAEPSAQRSSLWEARARAKSLAEEGILCGVLGAAVVALFFLLIDSLQGRPLYTPSLLGSVLFLGRSVEEAAALNPTMVFAYTGMHLLLFLMAGVVVAWMVSQFVSNPQFGFVLVLLFVLFEAVVFGFEVTLVPNLVGALGAGIVAAANLLAAAAMFGYLLRRHPEALEQLRQSWSD